MNRAQFDPTRSAAIRNILVATVEQTPRQRHRRHLRIAVIAIVAALVAAFGGAGVAIALTGGSLFTPNATSPEITSTSSATPLPASDPPSPTATPTLSPSPVVVTGDRIVPHDIRTSPAASHLWTVQLPGFENEPAGCARNSTLDVADGYALIQQVEGPESGEQSGCDSSRNRLTLSLADTRTGHLVWSREWSWAPSPHGSTSVRLLGTSGRLMLWNPVTGAEGPTEVLDVATGATVGVVRAPTGYEIHELNALPGKSGEVTFVASKLDANNQPTSAWSAMRADPVSLDHPDWSHDFEAQWSEDSAIGNSSSIYSVLYARPDGALVTDVLDVDTGAVMAAQAVDRSYRYFDGVTLRSSGFTSYGLPTQVAGIDDAGNEFWSRSDAAGLVIGRVAPPGQKPAAIALNNSSDVALVSSGNHLEVIDGPTGESRWTADSSPCDVDPRNYSASVIDFQLMPDRALVAFVAGHAMCGFNYDTGASLDVSTYRDTEGLGVSVGYKLVGGGGTGGDPSITGVPQASGSATAFDAVTGANLWTIPIASDETWQIAGGYVVGFSDGQMFGIG